TFPSMGRTQFFVNAGVGGATTQIDDLPGADDDFTRESSTELLVPVGGGLRFLNREVDPSWALRIDARDNIIFVDQFDTEEEDTDKEPTNNFELTAGLSFFFGGGGSSDFDGDGVDDDRDACPDTRAGVAVNDDGCPYDSDGDGVADDRDLCPNTPAGTRVDGSGCPLDSDSNGVTDDRDRCPNTPAGTMVDSDGCPVVEDKPDAAACVDGRSWFRGDDTISFEGRNWVKFGGPQSVSMDDLFVLTDYDGVPVYVRSDARRPYREALLPFCSTGNSYQLYQPERAVRGTTG
ncbi:MAG: thrombospondin type 3 repeat-containing protein, partial [Gemmatimonadota bacterium]